MSKRITATCDGCKKELGDYGWIDIHITEIGPTENFDGGDYQFCNKEPKHLRVGVNAAMVDHAGLVQLLIEKGIITEAEYLEAIRLAMNDELDRYENAIDPTRRIKLR